MICPRCGSEIDSFPCQECGFPEILKRRILKRKERLGLLQLGKEKDMAKFRG